MPRLFALDRNFPQPIVGILSDFQADATLVPLDRIDKRMSMLDDWELLLALHHHADAWDGLITTDSSMLAQGSELAALIQTELTLVVAVASGHNPVKASGLLFAYLAGICQRTTSDRAQVWRLNAANRPPEEPWDFLKRFAEHNDRSADEVWAEFKLAASTKPYGFMRFEPGPGMGGHCLPVDPFYLSWRAREFDMTTEFIELVQLYWEIGREILEREQREGWGSGVINRLASDLRREFPTITGFSRSNLHYMRSFAEAWPLVGGSEEIVQQPVGQLPWGQNIALLTKLKDRDGRLWYATKAVQNGWSRKVLEAQITTDLKGREGSALTSFGHEPSIGLVLCPGRSRTVTEWALRTVDAPVAVARYTTGEVMLTQTPPPEMKPALPDLPPLASELSNIVEAANAAYDDGAREDELGSGQHPTR